VTDAASDVRPDITVDTRNHDAETDRRRDATPDGATLVTLSGGCGCRVEARTDNRSARPRALVAACALFAALSVRRRRRARA